MQNTNIMQENLALHWGLKRRSEGHRDVSPVNKTVRKAEIISMNSLNIETDSSVPASEGWLDDKSLREELKEKEIFSAKQVYIYRNKNRQNKMCKKGHNLPQ